MQSTDPGTRKMLIVVVVVAAFIAGGVCTIAGMHFVRIERRSAAPVVATPAANKH